MPQLSGIVRKYIADSGKSRFRMALVLAISVVLTLEALMAMAPLTGSDALHYHFTAPSLWLQHGLAPLYGIVSSFGVGRAHMLIALGLALGSDHFSMGIIFLGGIFPAAALCTFWRVTGCRSSAA